MPSSAIILEYLIEEAKAAQAHFQVWRALRNIALPEFHETMNASGLRQFFHASNSGHYKLIFAALGKIYDSDTRVAGIGALKTALHDEGYGAAADALEAALGPVNSHVHRILTIRNRSVLHNEYAIPREKIYKQNGISSDEISDLIDATSTAINSVAAELGHCSRIPLDKSYEAATLALLEQLRHGVN